MTPADIVAEALRRAGDKTPHFMAGGEDGVVNEKYLGVVDTEIVFEASELDSEANYLRRDVVDAALAHLAERCAKAEERAKRLRKSLDDVMYAICENALRDEGEHAGAVCKRAIEADA